jgi:hypothetical protein
MDKLYFLTGPIQGATAELIGEEITIGRASDNGICIDDKSVSEHHAVIHRRNRECVLRDLQSARGTTVRGNRVVVVTLADSDRIAFGAVEAEFTTTEVKLHLPKTAAVAPPSNEISWPQRRTVPASPGKLALKGVVATVAQVAVVVALGVGGYWWYQKLNNAELPDEPPAAATTRVVAMPPPVQAPPPVVAPPAPSAVPTPPVAVAPAPLAVPPPPAPPAVSPSKPTVAAPPNPAVEKARLLIAQNKPQEAIAVLDAVIASATNPAAAAEAHLLLKQALGAQFASLQSVKQQWEAQSKLAEDRLQAARSQLDQDTKALEKKKAAEEKIYTMPGGRWFNGRWVPNTRKGTGDSSAQAAIQSLQLKTMTDSQEVRKQTDLINRYRAPISALEQQIAAIQARLAQTEIALNSTAQPGATPVLGATPASPPATALASASSAVPASAPAPSAPEAPAATADLDQLKPEDWVRSLPPQAQSAYMLSASQQGATRIEGVRHWLSLWSRHMKDPNLTLLELDYLKQMIEHRDPILDRALENARKDRDSMSKNEWGTVHQVITRKMSDLTSAGNKLMAMNVRSGKQVELAKRIGEHSNLAAKERSEMIEIIEHYKSVCRSHRWLYSWYW